jgi:hypothetical protein
VYARFTAAEDILVEGPPWKWIHEAPDAKVERVPRFVLLEYVLSCPLFRNAKLPCLNPVEPGLGLPLAGKACDE